MNNIIRRSEGATVVRLRAESPIIISAGQRPANGTPHIYQALKGRNPAVRFDFALSGLSGGVHFPHRALPCAIDYRAFSPQSDGYGVDAMPGQII